MASRGGRLDGSRSDDNSVTFCATCGHSEFVHSNNGIERCLLSACDCSAFVPGTTPEISPQVFPS
jgi:hypothetical protein